MGFFLSKTWPWWLLAAGLAVLVAWLIHRRGPSAKVAASDAAAVAGTGAVVGCGHEAELATLRGRVKTLEGEVEGHKVTAAVAAVPLAVVPAEPIVEKAVEEVVPDVAAGAKALGFPVKLDDLKVVEGIGPKIEGLLHADGIKTWRALSEAPAERLKGILDAAGPRYRVHNPTSWPRQAKMLVGGEWAAFKKLTDELTAGR
jgi:predicted flap endonuclease-1-like 5' DNA nuclease